MCVGDLVWIVGRPADGWVRTLGIITHIQDGWLYVMPNHNTAIRYKLSYGDVEPFEEKWKFFLDTCYPPCYITISNGGNMSKEQRRIEWFHIQQWKYNRLKREEEKKQQQKQQGTVVE